MTKKTTNFGFQRVPVAEKAPMVASVFRSVASRYDLMNDLMSLGLHRLWKRYAIAFSGVRSGHCVLDLAGGTGDMAAHLLHRVGSEGFVVLCDINDSMLIHGRDRLTDYGLVGNIEYVQANAECLPFDAHQFDCVTMAFGLYSFKVIPLLGKLVAGDSESYRYLAESIRMHPDQESLKEMMVMAGFERCDYFDLSAGIVSVHRGYKL